MIFLFIIVYYYCETIHIKELTVGATLTAGRVMNFRDALEKEIRSQGLAVAEIAKTSGLSKGAIYNILNGKTEEDRIRPSTRKQIATACNRELEVLEDGNVLFVEPGVAPHFQSGSEIQLTLIPERPFLNNSFIREPFDWLHDLEATQETQGRLTVDRVFQKRNDFLSLISENIGLEDVGNLRLELQVRFTGGQSGKFDCKLPGILHPGDRQERTIFLCTGPAFSLELLNPVYIDGDGETRQFSDTQKYVNEGYPSD